MTLSKDATDWSLARAGERAAFQRIYDRRKQQVRRQAARLLSSPLDVEDAVAVVFLEMWRRRDAVRLVEGSALPWLLTTTAHVAHNLRRGTRRYHALLARLPPPDPVPDPGDLVEDGRVVAALHRLSVTDQQVLTLCVLEDWSEREVAAALKVRPGTVKSRLHRAKKRLAAQLTAPIPHTKNETGHAL